MEQAGNWSQAEFERLVRDALLHLHDIARLQTHPLTKFTEMSPGNSAVLRGKLLLQSLLEAINSLHPAPGTSDQSRAWRNYRLLELRYIEGSNVDDVFGQLGISKSQYRRDHEQALQAVASVLWDRWQIQRFVTPPVSETLPSESLALVEARQVTTQLNPDYVDLVDMLSGLVALLRPITEESQTTLSLRVESDLTVVYADRAALRQIFIGLLNIALERGGGGRLDVSMSPLDGAVVVAVLTFPGPGVAITPKLADWANLEVQVIRQFVQALDGKLEVESLVRPGPWCARVTLPVRRKANVLIVDNHPDFVALAARYLAEHGWQVFGAQDVQQAQALALDLKPSAILLDVIMPGHDGWDLLLTLKSIPETRQIPVIVCSVLCEHQVARALGAADYLTKPITQLSLLAALAPWRPDKRVLVTAC